MLEKTTRPTSVFSGRSMRARLTEFRTEWSSSCSRFPKVRVRVRVRFRVRVKRLRGVVVWVGVTVDENDVGVGDCTGIRSMRTSSIKTIKTSLDVGRRRR